jgi:Pyruvate/2-oxoacid:ferredoxin oxidoreductase delta subunit
MDSKGVCSYKSFPKSEPAMSLLDRFVSPSTRAFLSAGRKTPNYSYFDMLHGYIYGRWTHLYIAIGTGRHPLAKRLAPLAAWFERQMVKGKKTASESENISMADTYHGKAVPLETAKTLVMIQENIKIPDLEQVIPYKRARSLILEHPDHIVALDCPCRSAKPNPCLPLDVCLVVGEPFASFVMEHNPDKARWITQQRASQILQEEDARGHVHHVFFKDAMLGRFYAICNCCSCCCGAMHAHQTGTPMLASSGYVCSVDEDICTGCLACHDYCQFDALGTDEFLTVVDEAKCMGCGVCVDKCPQEALSLKRDEARGEPLEIFKLMEKAAAAG